LMGTGTINGVLYVAGGRDTGEVKTRTLFAYNPATNSWASKALMPKPSGCGATGVIGGKLYVYGRCFYDTEATFQRYDPATNGWKTLAVPSRDHTFPAAGVVDGKLYLAGGGAQAATAVGGYEPGTDGAT